LWIPPGKRVARCGTWARRTTLVSSLSSSTPATHNQNAQALPTSGEKIQGKQPLGRQRSRRLNTEGRGIEVKHTFAFGRSSRRQSVVTKVLHWFL
jgi:hypothetical protein